MAPPKIPIMEVKLNADYIPYLLVKIKAITLLLVVYRKRQADRTIYIIKEKVLYENV